MIAPPTLDDLARQKCLTHKSDLAAALFPKYSYASQALLRFLRGSSLEKMLCEGGYFEPSRRYAFPEEVRLIKELVDKHGMPSAAEYRPQQQEAQ